VSLSSHTRVASKSLSDSIYPEGLVTLISTKNFEEDVKAFVVKSKDGNTGEDTSTISPSLIIPLVYTIHVDVCGTTNDDTRFDKIILVFSNH
jgi:hypothetical protein